MKQNYDRDINIAKKRINDYIDEWSTNPSNPHGRCVFPIQSQQFPNEPDASFFESLYPKLQRIGCYWAYENHDIGDVFVVIDPSRRIQ